MIRAALFPIGLTAIMAFAVGIIATIGAISGSGGLGAYLGRDNPVNTSIKITRIEAAPDGHSDIWGEFDLLRAEECSFQGFDWKLGKRGARTVPVEVNPSQRLVRENGPQEFGPWRLNITPDQVPNSHADVLHDCGWSWLLTRTVLYK